MEDRNEQNQETAQPIELEGETWAPTAEDDAAQVAPARSSFFFGEDGLRAGWSFALYLVLLVVLVTVFSPITMVLDKHLPKTAVVNGQKLEMPSRTLISHGILLLALLPAAWAMSKIETRRMAQYGLGLPTAHRLKQFVVGAVWGVALLSLLVFTLKALGLLVFDGVAEAAGPAVTYGLKWLAAMLLVGMTEEYMLRGFFQFTLARGIGGLQKSKSQQAAGFWISALIMSALFGAIHLGNKGETHFGVLMAGLAGLVLCISLWRTGSLWWGIGWHMGWNWAQSFLYGVGDSATYAYGHLLNSHVQGDPRLSGGAVGPEGSLFVIPTLLVTALVMWFSIRDEGYPEHQR